MTRDLRKLELPPGAVLKARQELARELSPDEFLALLNTPWSPEEEEEARALISWFLRRYPTPAQRLAKARRSYRQWARSAPAEVQQAECEARGRDASAPRRDG